MEILLPVWILGAPFVFTILEAVRTPKGETASPLEPRPVLRA